MARLGNEVVDAIRDYASPQKILQLAKETHAESLGQTPPGISQDLFIQHYLMCHAVQHNHVELVKSLINDGYDIKFTEDHRLPVSPLHIACEGGKAEVLQLFVSQKPDVYRKVTGWTVSYTDLKSPLCLILEVDREDLVDILVPLLKEDHLEHLTFRTPLHLACQYGALKCARFLSSKFPEDINKNDVHGNTPLMLAVKKGAEIVRLVLDHKARTDAKTVETKRQCLHLLFCVAVPTGPCYLTPDAHSIAGMLIDAGADVNAEDIGGETPLSLLCGHVRANLHQWVQQMLPQQEIVNNKAIMNCVNLLLHNGALLNSDGSRNVPLHVILNSATAAIDMYCGRRGYTQENDLHRITTKLDFSVEMLEHLLKKGADPNALNVYLYTPLSQLFVHLFSNSYVDPVALDDIWPNMRQIFLLLLRHGANKCQLKEAFWHPPHRTDVIQMVINSMPHDMYSKQVGDVCKHIKGRPPASQANILEHHQWILQVASQPRSLLQISRALLYSILRTTLIEAVPNLLLPVPISEYILSFED